MMGFEAVIGLEVHAQLKTDTKIFCGCATTFGAPPNTHVCPVCLGMPGVLPVLNKKVVEFALFMAMATDCEIHRLSRFARKNYFYPDLPKGYQISQYELPIAYGGHLAIDTGDMPKDIGITRIHMEEDAGKLIHEENRPYSLVDYNRTGVPLIEIVSEPDLRTPSEAGAYLRKLRAILRYLDICDGNMEEGSFRCDANVSIRPQGTATLGTRAELKNLNSFKHVEKAIAYEITRQQDLILDGGQVVQETRLWNPAKNNTNSMRSKEEAHDYRYFPDPDLLPIAVNDEWLEKIRKSLPELPEEKKARFVNDYGLPAYDAEVLTTTRDLADYYEECVHIFANPKQVSNWLMGNLLGMLKAQSKTIKQTPVSAKNLAKLLKLIDQGLISAKIAKTVFEEMADSGADPQKIVADRGLTQVSDSVAIETVIDDMLNSLPVEVERYRNGQTKLMGFFVGQVMRATKGKANPVIVNAILKAKLAS
jgi:aspartyl-tRNA(Asn)/glutamyl-tRNA(Gln) amidotransferase subunit B